MCGRIISLREPEVNGGGAPRAAVTTGGGPTLA